jgi:tetratricopeptide (TPR) repeat protein
LQAEIANDIAHKIEFTLAKSSAAHGKAPLTRQGEEAYDLYLKGRYFWNKRTPEGFQRAIEYFQEAIGKDPSFARAYAGLADSYALMSGYTASPPGDLIPKAQAAAHRAVELDDSLAEAHTSMAVVAQNFDWDWVTAEREYRRAIALDDNYAQAHHWYGEYLGFMGRYDEAFAELERARQLDPLSLIIACDKGVILYYARQYDAALKQLLAVQDLDPYFPRLAVIDGVYIQKGMYAEALTDLKKRPSDGAWDWGTRATIYGRLGRDAEARLSLREWQRLERRRHVDPLSIMSAYIAMGKKDLAIATLQKAYSEHSIGLAALKVDPTFDPLRDEEKFQELLRRTHLAP